MRGPAKLTLTLRVTGVRADGYHLIDAEMVSLALADTLTITPDGIGITCDGPFAPACRSTSRTSSRGAAARRTHGAACTSTRRSRTAVASVAARPTRRRCCAGRVTTISSARRALGADVPFCLVGGRAMVRGIGELIEPLPFEPIDVTLVIPPLAVSTPAVYRAWDELGGPRTRRSTTREPAAIAVEPDSPIGATRIEEAAGWRPTLAGSGATWFLRGHHEIAPALPDAVVLHTDADAHRPASRQRRARRSSTGADGRSRGQGHLPRWRWWRVRRSIFLCFFLRMRLRRFLISEPIARETLSGARAATQTPSNDVS